MELITSTCENGILTVCPHDRIDTGNAAEAGEKIDGLLSEFQSDQVILDAEDLKYISSAGLRVVLKLKKAKPALRVINVVPEVYEIFEMTGFTDIMTIEKAYRRMSVEGCEIIGKGAKGTVYRYNADTVIKVYNNVDSLGEIKRERELARKAFVLGIPTAISYDVVKVGELYGSVFELLDTVSFSRLLREHPDQTEAYVRDFALLARKLHDTKVQPGELPDARDLPRKWLRLAAKELDQETTEKLAGMIEAIPESGNLLHCDYHTNNVMYQEGEIMLIDLDTMSAGHPVIELANTYVTYDGFTLIDPQNVEDFLGVDAEQAKTVWKYFLPAYLGTEDGERLESVGRKVKLLGFLRILHHISKRNDGSEKMKGQIAACAEEIRKMTKEADSFVF